jgi:hypothetical protein
MEAEAMAAMARAGGVVYFKFTREFIVPVMHDRKVESLVILNINLEADSSISQKLFSMEPKIRDNIMTTLIELSNDGRTFENITDVESYETIRAMVLMNLQKRCRQGFRMCLLSILRSRISDFPGANGPIAPLAVIFFDIGHLGRQIEGRFQQHRPVFINRDAGNSTDETG